MLACPNTVQHGLWQSMLHVLAALRVNIPLV